jgi:hypothetical protein
MGQNPMGAGRKSGKRDGRVFQGRTGSSMDALFGQKKQGRKKQGQKKQDRHRWKVLEKHDLVVSTNSIAVVPPCPAAANPVCRNREQRWQAQGSGRSAFRPAWVSAGLEDVGLPGNFQHQLLQLAALGCVHVEEADAGHQGSMDGLNDAGKPERHSVTAKLDFDPAVDSPGKMPVGTDAAARCAQIQNPAG